MFELVKLTIKGFRGFTREQEFIFDCPVTLLHGENHRGKSSTLNAVEWCLFGDECIGRKTGIRERLGWEIANRYARMGDVTVVAEFRGPDGTYKVSRRQDVARRRGGQSATVVIPGGSEFEGDDAEALIYSLFRSSFQDFMATVYQHQEAIRAVLTQEPRERNDAIDRLLGLSSCRELLRGLAAAKAEDVLKHLEDERESFRLRCEQAIRTLENLLTEEKAKAQAEDLVEEQMTEGGAIEYAKRTAEGLVAFATELGVRGFQAKVPSNFEEVDEFLDWGSQQVDFLFAQAPEVQRQDALIEEQQNLGTLRGKLAAAKVEETKARSENDKFVREYGDEAALIKDEEAQQSREAEIDDKMRETNSRAKLVGEAIQYLEQFVPETERRRCPLCGTESPDLITHLRAEWEATLKAAIQELDRQKKECQSKISEIGVLRARLKKLVTNLDIARSNLRGCVEEMGAALGIHIGETDDPLVLVDQRLQQIVSELNSIREAITLRRGTLASIEKDLKNLTTLKDIVTHLRRKERIEQIWESPEFTELEEQLTSASLLVEDIAAIRTAVAAVSREEAESKTQAAQEGLTRYFSRMVKHPTITGLAIEVTEDRRTGLNSYSFKCNDGTDPAPILSQGDLNCFALSLFLGLAEAAGDTQRFSFLMLDDPTQSLGPEMKKELTGVLEAVASRRSLIISTPDTEFRQFLGEGITKKKAVYEFANWTRDGGPQVIRES